MYLCYCAPLGSQTRNRLLTQSSRDVPFWGTLSKTFYEGKLERKGEHKGCKPTTLWLAGLGSCLYEKNPCHLLLNSSIFVQQVEPKVSLHRGLQLKGPGEAERGAGQTDTQGRLGSRQRCQPARRRYCFVSGSGKVLSRQVQRLGCAEDGRRINLIVSVFAEFY